MATTACPYCGGQNRAGARHCVACGRALQPAQVVPGALTVKKPLLNAGQGLRGLGRPFARWLPTANRKHLAVIVLALVCFAAVALLLSLPGKPGGRVAGIGATPTLTPEEGLRATILSLPSIVPTAGPLATIAEIAKTNGKIEIPRVTDQEEIEIGREAAAEFERTYSLSNDPALTSRVEQIGRKILPYQPRQNLPFTFKVVETDEINAFALPGGIIYVTHGLIDYIDNDDELAGVIGHEIAHVAMRHSAQQIEVIAAADAALQRISSEEAEIGNIYEDQRVQIAVQVTGDILLTGWGRDAEFQADEYGTIYMAQAGYNPQAVIDLFRRLSQYEIKPNNPIDRLMATHPPFSERIERVEQAITVRGL